MSQLADPVPPPGYSGQPPSARPGSGTGLAVAAMVLGILALLGCWVPLLNVLSVLLALAGLGVGVPALVLAVQGRRGGRGMALAGVITSAVAIIGSVVVTVVFSAALGGIADALQSADSDSTATAGPPSSTSSPSADPEPPPAAEALALGTAAQVGEYAVTVTGVDQDADARVAEQSEFNPPPTGRYILVDLTVTYTGTEEGDAWIDLAPTYRGTDARDYDSSSCTAVTPDPAIEQPTLRTGGTASFSVCFDLPPEAVAGGQVAVEELISLSGEPVLWAAP